MVPLFSVENGKIVGGGRAAVPPPRLAIQAHRSPLIRRNAAPIVEHIGQAIQADLVTKFRPALERLARQGIIAPFRSGVPDVC